MAGNCMCNETGVLIFPCSGGSDVGELSDRAARKMAKCGQAKMFCLAGAIMKDEYLRLIKMVGFQDVKIISESSYPVGAMFDNLESAEDAIVSIKVSAVKK